MLEREQTCHGGGLASEMIFNEQKYLNVPSITSTDLPREKCPSSPLFLHWHIIGADLCEYGGKDYLVQGCPILLLGLTILQGSGPTLIVTETSSEEEKNL